MDALEVKKKEVDDAIKTSTQSSFKEVQDMKQKLNEKVGSFIDAGIRNLTGRIEEIKNISPDKY
ncbi:hypothetical protein DPMN_192732 [Dreissena polymorpha]|uniref:Uncharacterized protein n=1 Tax=Dreissena polymorpha TaxID=45954 RepID=A0A9D3Y3S7_DREPO|nr:hypothetical protein DPMN_192732 [Dreissena polymorpha]